MRSKDETRTLLLEAGCELVLEIGLGEGVDVKLTDVLDRVGLSTGAAYNVFKNQTEYREDLALHVAETYEWADASVVLEAIAQLGAESTADDWVRAVANAYFPVFVQNMHFYSTLHFWTVREPRPELTAAIERGYNTTHDAFVALYQSAVDHYGLRPVAPYTLDDLTTMVTGALEGLALRHRFQSERLDTEGGHAFTSVMLAIAQTYLEPRPT